MTLHGKKWASTWRSTLHLFQFTKLFIIFKCAVIDYTTRWAEMNTHLGNSTFKHSTTISSNTACHCWLINTKWTIPFVITDISQRDAIISKTFKYTLFLILFKVTPEMSFSEKFAKSYVGVSPPTPHHGGLAPYMENSMGLKINLTHRNIRPCPQTQTD